MDYLQENKLPNQSCYLVIMTVIFSIVIILSNVEESFSQKDGSIDISVLDSSYIPLTNTDANQVRVNVKYTLEDDKVQNQLINAVMEVYAPNGTLIRTTSIGNGFTVQIDGGEQVLRTTILDKSLQSVSIKVLFTDLSKEVPLSNVITDDLELDEDPRTE